MEVIGKVLRIEEVNQISPTFKKREVIINTGEGDYVQTVSLQLSQNKCDIINGYKPGDELTFSINLRGREWTSPKGEVRVFNTLEVWKIEGETAAEQVKRDMPIATDFEADSDLPF